MPGVREDGSVHEPVTHGIRHSREPERGGPPGPGRELRYAQVGEVLGQFPSRDEQELPRRSVLSS